MRDKLEAIGNDLFSLRDFTPNDHNIKLRRQGLNSASLEELYEAVASATQLQWRAQPSYFGALTLECNDRVNAALSLIPSNGSD